mmetsp:Transcript_7887/g.19018  ORF Transcript_7887/g.19018 Transcript_7887/m.19018 type:complete len:882 (-) Transcript_7887:30-2675(-)
MRILRGSRIQIVRVFQWGVLCCVLGYSILLFQMHNLTIHDYSNSHPMKWIEDFYSSENNGYKRTGVQNPVGIREGSVKVNEYMASGKDLWEHSHILPTWMKEFFVWHKAQRNRLQKHPEEWDQLKYYLIECTESYQKCGGTADRLGPLPFHVKVASETNRLLLIHWTKPAPLEEFLEPPSGGLDWRVPSWLLGNLRQETAKRTATHEKQIWKYANYAQARLLSVKFQSHDHSQEGYNRTRRSQDEPSFLQVYHDLWRVVFTPNPRIANQIEQYMGDFQLQPGGYITVHLRALYAVEERQEDLVEWWSQNSINCATTKLPKHTRRLPLLFVSDSDIAVEAASKHAQAMEKNHGIRVLHRPHAKTPLHLEKTGNRTSGSVSDFDDVFVDLYTIGMSQCTVYNMGGFGRLGSAIGYNSSCTFQTMAHMIKCNPPEEVQPHLRAPQRELSTPLFLPPMMAGPKDFGVEPIVDEAAKSLNTNKNLPPMMEEAGDMQIEAVIDKDPLLYAKFFNTSETPNLWKSSHKIPKWMKKYFRWHREQRNTMLNPDNWKSMRLLIMECLDTHESCGGTSDRLKPLPSLIRMAHISNRFLLIHWTRPAKLEEFLLPPKGGMDWRVPDWLHPLLIGYSFESPKAVDPRPSIQSKHQSISVRYQSYDAGQGWYDSEKNTVEATFNELYHDIWRVFFTPALPIAKAIKAFMSENGLVPGHYSSAHVRVLYALKTTPIPRIMRWTKNGLNCASHLRPGKPIFLASDSHQATQIAEEYAKKRNTTIHIHPNNPDPPLHLDKGEDINDHSTPRRPPSDYYDTFIDLYIMAFGQCVFISKGGYGHWANLIGGNTTCIYKQKRAKKGISNPCNWTFAADTTLGEDLRITEPLFNEPILQAAR